MNKKELKLWEEYTAEIQEYNGEQIKIHYKMYEEQKKSIDEYNEFKVHQAAVWDSRHKIELCEHREWESKGILHKLFTPEPYVRSRCTRPDTWPIMYWPPLFFGKTPTYEDFLTWCAKRNSKQQKGTE